MSAVLDSKGQALLSSVPDTYRLPLIEEFNKILRNYRENRWEPAELNGGKFCEIVYSILDCHIKGVYSTGPTKPGNMVDACRALEAASSFSRSLRIQIPRMIVSLYEIRNNRNVGHVGSDVDPNHMDATVVVQMSRWILGELIRAFHNLPVEEATQIVDAITERSLSIVWKLDGATRILDNSLSAKEKTLLLLYSEQRSMPVSEILRIVEYKNSTQFKEKILRICHKEALLHFDEKKDAVTLSPLGMRYVEGNIKLEL